MPVSGLKGIAAQQVKQQGSMAARRLATDLVASYNRGYNFYVELNGYGFSFTKVSGIEKGVNMEPLQEGGYNGYSHQLRTQEAGNHVLTLEYGSTNINFMLDGIEPGRYFPDGVYVTTLGHNSLLSGKMICLEGCYLQKISFGELDAERSAILINRMEIAYSRITLPSMFG